MGARAWMDETTISHQVSPSATPAGPLSQVPFLAALDADDLRDLAQACPVRRFKPGVVLFHEGDPGAALFLLEAGHVKIVHTSPDGEETVLHIYGPGEHLGEIALLDGAPRSATAVALDQVEARMLFRQPFLALLERRPSAALAVMSGLAGMIRRLNEQVQDAAFLDAPSRLAKQLRVLAEQHGEPTPQGRRIALRITQEELAQMIGSRRHNVNRYLAEFQERGLLTMDRDGITLHPPV
jgi:CRP/FNR family cyclic AMP-dependent transcriptional regulator